MVHRMNFRGWTLWFAFFPVLVVRFVSSFPFSSDSRSCCSLTTCPCFHTLKYRTSIPGSKGSPRFCIQVPGYHLLLHSPLWIWFPVCSFPTCICHSAHSATSSIYLFSSTYPQGHKALSSWTFTPITQKNQQHQWGVAVWVCFYKHVTDNSEDCWSHTAGHLNWALYIPHLFSVSTISVPPASISCGVAMSYLVSSFSFFSLLISDFSHHKLCFSSHKKHLSYLFVFSSQHFLASLPTPTQQLIKILPEQTIFSLKRSLVLARKTKYF